ncbi:C40 family peptidase [Erysipelotrichaceae bacterium RD49]|nr:C40 family peptidase [Erysipelotrichaceae bacterium RD49]
MKKQFKKAVLSLGTTLMMTGAFTSAPVYAAQNEPVVKTVQITGLENNRQKVTTEGVQAARKTGFTQINGKTVYLDENGEKLTGTLTTDAGSYYFNANGEMQTGFVNRDGSTYYYNTNGQLETGVVSENGKTYVLDADGKTQTGWVEDNGTKYFLNDDGSAVSGEIKTIDQNQYSFAANGQMETNVTRGNYTYGADGIGVGDPSAYDRIAQAALAQIGVTQDCTMLVTNSLKAVGINFHGAPSAYLSLGPLTDNPVPGDIIVYQGHVAIYIGNGRAVHGGWNGYTTAEFSVECSTPLIGYVHPILP